MSSELLPGSFYDRDALEVARDLLGCHIVRDEIVLRVTEVEAYRWPGDSANHCFAGRTKRNEPMWGPPGHAYIYLCYGIHHLLNFVTGPADEGAAVLIRSCEPIEGLDLIRSRRRGLDGPALLTGPGKVGSALGLDTSWNDHRLFDPGGLEVRAGDQKVPVLRGPRIGIDFARPKDVRAPWRLAAAGTLWVSQRSKLRS